MKVDFCYFQRPIGPGKDCTSGPFLQSQRLDLYIKYIAHLLAIGKAYRCYCSRERLELLRGADGHGRYDGTCRNLPEAYHQKHSSAPFVVRFRTPPGVTTITDIVYGSSEMSNRLVDDAVLLKTDGFPTYHFANVVDDHLMNITTVMRGQEWLPSTALHLLLYQAFDWKAPRFAHLPLLINKDGSKISKRQGDVFIEQFRDHGYFPSALLNFVAFLGWSPASNQEDMTLKDLVDSFEVSRIHRADALVNMEKLAWHNRNHFRRLVNDPSELPEIVTRMRSRLPGHEKWSDEYLSTCAKLMSV
ncbi:Glutamate-tRNA ligase, variant [Paramicrosporidium saccamoebae]|uniref:Glutamate-tRNA ligase, variant n=1 Tax=Paramicrosporidium saccamoebae TaxID=1246581 RepID=A0A2H9TGP2_9FUNG|nr:Glutamate-tRNA ligase, variant [Paramicrosporidium saccamoebae]